MVKITVSLSYYYNNMRLYGNYRVIRYYDNSVLLRLK